jgi:MFS family permease
MTMAGVVMGWVAGHSGARPVVRIMGGLYLFAPIFAYLSGFSADSIVQTVFCSLAFLLIGMGDGSIILGFLNYVLEISPSSQRPVYIGLTNTLAGFTILYPLLGGWLAGWMGYRLIFLLAVAGIAVGWIVSWTLPAPRPKAGAPDGGKTAGASNAV